MESEMRGDKTAKNAVEDDISEVQNEKQQETKTATETVADHLTGKVQLEITGGNGDVTTRTQADCYYRNGRYYILFCEELDPEKKGDAAFSSRLKISGEEVTLRRSRKNKQKNESRTVMEMIYRMGTKDGPGCMVNYPTPYGIIKLEIRTEEIFMEESADVLEVNIIYRMFQQEQEVSRDRIRIFAKK